MSAERVAYIAGLRKLAAALEASPGLTHPSDGRSPYPFSLHVYVGTADEFREWASLLTSASEGIDGDTYRLVGALNGLHLSVSVAAKNVGRTVTREVETFEVEPFLSVVSS